ncbi:MAG: Ni/Fe hydrogenase subunit gamma [bacterium]|nr:Ni/Fe hydrogenase subunit gamma [bacterium]
MANASEILQPEALSNEMLPRLYTVNKLYKDTHDTFTMELVPADGGPSMSFLPGQFNMLYVFGVGEVPISISGDPDRAIPLVHTLREVGSVTSALRTLKAGDTVGVRGPYGTAWPVDQAVGHDLVLLAGGIGLAPLRPVLYSILFRRRKYGKVVLLFGTRSPGDILYKKELQKWRSRFDLDIHITVDRAIRPWRGNVGVVTSLIPRASFDPMHTTAMICGPEIMMRFSIMELTKRGVPEDHIWVSMERNMKCGCGFCGHCQCGPLFVCKDGPVFVYPRIKDLMNKYEI